MVSTILAQLFLIMELINFIVDFFISIREAAEAVNSLDFATYTAANTIGMNFERCFGST